MQVGTMTRLGPAQSACGGWRVWSTPLRLISACFLLAAAASVSAVEPGEVITAANAERIADQVSPGVMWCIQHGMNLTVAPYKKIELPKAYVTATEQYSGQVHLSKDGTNLEGYVAGEPFPTIDPSDPAAAIKIMWNYYYRPYYSDDYLWRNFLADTGPLAETGLTIERRYLIQQNARLFFNGRLYVDPKPELPNPQKLRFKELTGPVLEPLDLKGVGQLGYRYLDPGEADDTWLYLPTLRRVRRVSSAQRSDSVFGQDIDADSYAGYSGSIAWGTWRFLGEKTMLGVFHARHSPVQWCPGAGDFAFCDDWEPRKVYVVEGASSLPQYAYSKRVLYIDQETMWVLYMDAYDRAGNLWKTLINQWRSVDRPSSNPSVTVYPDEQLFNPSFIMVDIQLQHATRSWTPTEHSPTGEEEFFNVGSEKTGIRESHFAIGYLTGSSR